MASSSIKRLVGVLLLVVLGIPSNALQADRKSRIAFVDVNVVPMDREIVLPRQTVLVEDGKIVAVGPIGSVSIPQNTRRIDGTNRYLMPGLVDMHVHFIRPTIPGKPQKSSGENYAAENGRLALLFVANGVTSVRNMWGHPAILKFNKQIIHGDILGPTIYSVGPLTDGDPPVNLGSRLVTTEQEAKDAVREDKERGYIAIKVYNNLTPDAYQAIVAAAGNEKLAVVGHTPRLVGLLGVLDAHQSSIEHFSSFARAALSNSAGQEQLSLDELFKRADLDKLPKIAESVKAAEVWTCPTVVQVQYDAERDVWAKERSYVPRDLVDRYEQGKVSPLDYSAERKFALSLVRALHGKGAGLLLGTDAYKPNIIPGFSLHEELRYFVEAGLSPYESIRAGTSDAARFLHREDEFGTIAVGRRADLLLLNANPLEDVTNVSKRVGIVLRGQWLPEQQLQKDLKRLPVSAH